MQTATLKEATTKLGVSLDDVVRYQTLGNSAIIEIDLKLPQPAATDHAKPTQPEKLLTPEEEFCRKYPNIPITRPELFKLVGCVMPSTRSDKDELLDAIEEKYQ